MDNPVADTPADFKLTEDQEGALAFLNEFYASGDRMACLMGAAGTGKTTTLGLWLKGHANCEPRIVVVAPTNKAKGVLQSKCPTDGNLLYCTVAQFFGERLVENENTLEDEFVGGLGEPIYKNIEVRFVIVDECSMVSQKDLDSFTSVANGYGIQILFVGDHAQLPPVDNDGKSKLSPTFSIVPRFTLTQVVRQALDSPVIALATWVRGRPPCLLSQLEAFFGRDMRLTKMRRNEITDAAIRGIRSGFPVQILTCQKATARKYNRTIHDALHPDCEPPFAVGEQVVAHEPKYDGQGLALANGELAIVVHIKRREPYVTEYVKKDGTVLKQINHLPIPHIDQWSIKLKRPDGRVMWVNYADEAELTKAIRELKVSFSNRKYLDHSSYKGTVPIGSLKESDEGKLISRIKNDFTELSHAYAMTVHKSQGSTFDNVIVDWGDLGVYGYKDKERDMRIHYTAITRASKFLGIAADWY